MVQIDGDGTVIELHCPIDHEFMLSSDGLVGKKLIELLPTQMALQAKHYLEKALRTRKRQVFTCQYVLPGRTREYQARIGPCGSTQVIAVIRDVTDRRAFEKEILDVCHRTQLRIGQDLHDGLGQHLSGITFLSKALEKKLSHLGLAEAKESAEIANLVIQALAQTRNLARGLFPIELESGGLVPALKELAATMRSLYKLSCAVEYPSGWDIRDQATANHLFRLTQEAVNNAVKHGHASAVTIRLTSDGDQSMLSITDDGTGFDADRNDANGLGMRIMRYRAKRIGAQLEIHPSSTGGTEVICKFKNSAMEFDASSQNLAA